MAEVIQQAIDGPKKPLPSVRIVDEEAILEMVKADRFFASSSLTREEFLATRGTRPLFFVQQDSAGAWLCQGAKCGNKACWHLSNQLIVLS